MLHDQGPPGRVDRPQVFERIELMVLIMLEYRDRIIGMQLSGMPTNNCSTEAPSGGERFGPSPALLIKRH